MRDNTQLILTILVLALVIVSAVIDWRNRRIPNMLTLGGALVAFACQSVLYGLDGFINALSGWAIGFAFLMPGYILHQTGAGDVKLMATAGAFLGPGNALLAAIASILIGASISLLIATFGRGDSPWKRYGNMLRCILATGKVAYVPPQEGEVMNQSFPFAIAIAAGTIVALGWPSLLGALKA